MSMKPLLVGEDNPYGKDPRYALFPHPKNSAGYRLARLVLAMPSRGAYLEGFDRINLCAQKWTAAAARTTVISVMSSDYDRVVLLGVKVAKAFGFVDRKPFQIDRVKSVSSTGVWFERKYILLPHPSGLCRVWNEPQAFERARAVLVEGGVLS